MDQLDEKEFFEKTLEKYLSLCSQLSSLINKEGESILISINEKLLIRSISEACVDYKFIKARRQFKIISEGKIAGIIAFRLSRYRPIYSNNSIINEDSKFVDMHITMAVLMALSYINLQWLQLDMHIRKEIFFTIKSRHVNQETLGLVFDSILKSHSN